MEIYREKETLMADKPLVAILMGSASDMPVMEKAVNVLREKFGVASDVKVLSAHRTPDETAAFVSRAARDGVEVFIAGAGWAAHLAGAVAANTTLPVIGVPLAGSPLQGFDSLLSTVQMPPGIPVATVAVGCAENAGVLAAEILSIKYPDVKAALETYRREMREKVLAGNK
jgi:5-(carboxyamino)imidazole ribonucleotide mutase